MLVVKEAGRSDSETAQVTQVVEGLMQRVRDEGDAALLELTKEFAKWNRSRPDSALPLQVATVLYFASVAAALARCGRRLSTLQDSALLDGFEWARTREWVDEPTQRLMREGAESLRHERSGGDKRA